MSRRNKRNKANKVNSNINTDVNKQPTPNEVREWYNQNHNNIELFKQAQAALKLFDPTKSPSRNYTIFSREKLRTFMRNPAAQYKNLRNLSRFLYFRSHAYRRLIHYNASMINLNYRSVIPLVDITKNIDHKKTVKNYYQTLSILEFMNLPLEFLKVYITCWREDVFYGCVYFDKSLSQFFILPLDPDYCKITSIYPSGDFGFDMDMSYFAQKQDVLTMWGEPFVSMYKEYQKDTVNHRWVPMPDENAICLKVNIDDWEIPLPPYMALFDRLINLEDLVDIMAIADEQTIYKLLVAKIPLISGSTEVNDFAVDPKTAIEYYNKIVENLPDYTNAIISPIDIDTIVFDQDQANDVNKIENATKSVFNVSGGAQILNSASISGTTAWNGAIRSDEEYALSSLLPQTQAWINRFLGYHLSKPSKVVFLETTRYTVKDFKDSIIKDATYGLPNKLMINTLNGLSELDTLSLNFLEEDCLELSSKFVPLQSSNTMNTGELKAGGQTKPDSERTDDGEASIDKRDRA